MQQTSTITLSPKEAILSGGYNISSNKTQINLIKLGAFIVLPSLCFLPSIGISASISTPQIPLEQEIISDISSTSISEVLQKMIRRAKYSFVDNETIDESSFIYDYCDL
jgi:hypothetical protein